MPDYFIELSEETREEENTQEAIMDRMGGRLPADLSPRPASPQYLALQPASVELEKCHIQRDEDYENAFLHTCDRENLIRRAKDYNMAPDPATPAILEGHFNIPVPIGSQFSCGDYDYTVMEENGRDGTYFSYYLRCNTEGAAGNTELGRMQPLQTMTGLTYCYLVRVVIPGEEEEETEAFRARVIARLQYKQFCGNRPDYIRELTAMDGVGRVKIDACPDGEKLRVDLYFTDSELGVPSPELIERVQEYFYPLENGELDLRTTGNGLAPIGHLVKAVGMEPFTVDVRCGLELRDGYSIEDVREPVRAAVLEYFRKEVAEWGDTEMTEKAKFPRKYRCQLTYTRVGAAVLEVPGVLDYHSIGITNPDGCAWNQIPVLGELWLYD